MKHIRMLGLSGGRVAGRVLCSSIICLSHLRYMQRNRGPYVIETVLCQETYLIL